ncbi:MAG: hypothetical protein O2816_18445, partial [Planctomycetota bacterium]|nr:hypothetical protein [Planctomycetota bacterium]
LAPAELARLRERASTQAVWGDLAAAVASSAAPGIDVLLDEHGMRLPDVTRASVGEWIRFKDNWLHGGEDVGVLTDLIEGIGPALHPDAGGVFTLPDLDGLMNELEWSEAADGSRRGVLDLSEEGPGSSSRVRIEVHTSSSSSRR